MALKDDRFYNECRGYSEMVFLFIRRSIKNRIHLIMKKETKHELLSWGLYITCGLFEGAVFGFIAGIKYKHTLVTVITAVGIILSVFLIIMILYLNPYKKHKTKKRDRQKNIQMIENNKKDEQSNKE